jgi:hypothetical protein
MTTDTTPATEAPPAPPPPAPEAPLPDGNSKPRKYGDGSRYAPGEAAYQPAGGVGVCQ